MWIIPQFSVDFFTFTIEIFYKTLDFFVQCILRRYDIKSFLPPVPIENTSLC